MWSLYKPSFKKNRELSILLRYLYCDYQTWNIKDVFVGERVLKKDETYMRREDCWNTCICYENYCTLFKNKENAHLYIRMDP